MYEDFADPELEYQKDSKLGKDDVSQLKEWLKKENHLPSISEMKLLLFLHSNFYNVESSKRAIENFYTTRTECPEFFSKRNPKDEHLQDALKTSLITILPVRTKENYPILLAKLVDLMPEKFDLNETFKLIDMVVSLTQTQTGTSPGQIMVIDAKDFNLGHFLRCNINALRKYLFFVQEASPIRLTAVHVVNISTVTEKFSSLARPFVKRDIYEAIHFHKTVEGLEGFVPKEALPSEMGGTAGTCAELQEKNAKNLVDHYQFFLDEEKEVADESKRVGVPKTSSELFGIGGSFKKLEVD